MSSREPIVIGGQPIGRLKASWLLFKEAWKYLRADKEMVWIPFIATFINLALFGILIAVFVLGGGLEVIANSQEGTVSPMEWAFVFLCYVIGAFSVAISQAGISHTVYTRAHGGDATLGQSLRTAFSHWVSLLVWSVITSTVGVLLRMIAERSKLLGRIIAALLGSAWSVLTYFVVPAMVIDKKTAFSSIGKSAQVFKATWGETIVSNISLGLTFLIAHVLVFLSAFGLGFLAVTIGSMSLAIVVLVAYLLWLVIAILVSSAMGSILKTLLYIYATEEAHPVNFNSELLEKMLQRPATQVPTGVPTSTSVPPTV